MEIPTSSERTADVDRSAGSFFRIAIPAWDWGRSMVGLSPSSGALSRDEVQRIFRQDLSFEARTRDQLRRPGSQKA